MNVKQFHVRVWMGLREFGHQHYGATGDARVVVHPTVRAMLAMETDAFEWQREADGTERYRGVLLEFDPRIGEDSILIRHEVKA